MLVYNYWPERIGGAENQCRQLVKCLTASGTNCFVITGRHTVTLPVPEEDEGIVIWRLATFETLLQRFQFRKIRGIPQMQFGGSEGLHTRLSSVESGKETPPSFLSKTTSMVVRYLNALVFGCNVFFFLCTRRKNISVIHVHIADWLAGVAGIAGMVCKIPVLCKGANQPVFPDLKGIPFSYMLDCQRRRIVFIALTESMKQELLQQGISEKKIHVIPNGVHIPEKMTNAQQNTSFLFVGNFSQTAAHKGFDILLQAWQEVVGQEPKAQLILVGGGDASPWQALAYQLRIEQTITFAGFIDNLENYYLNSGCFVLPSRKEGISNALLEAQSYGLPAIVSDIPGNREIVEDGKTGLIVSVGNSAALAQAMLALYHDPILRKKFGKAAREKIEKHFAIHQISGKINELYKNLAPL